MIIDFRELLAVDAPTRKRPQKTNQLEIMVDGIRVGVISDRNGATAMITEEVAEVMKPMIRESVMRQLASANVRDVKFLPPRPIRKRATGSDF